MENFHNNQLNIPLANKLFSLYKTTYKYLKYFPKKERYTLGEKIENNILEMLQKIYYINQLPDSLKEAELLKLNAKNEMLKLLFRLAHEIAILDETRYLTAQSFLQEIGKMIGGWIKYLKSRR